MARRRPREINWDEVYETLNEGNTIRQESGDLVGKSGDLSWWEKGLDKVASTSLGRGALQATDIIAGPFNAMSAANVSFLAEGLEERTPNWVDKDKDQSIWADLASIPLALKHSIIDSPQQDLMNLARGRTGDLVLPRQAASAGRAFAENMAGPFYEQEGLEESGWQGSELLDLAGVQNDKLRTGAGFGIDMAFDPLTYLTGGSVPIAARAARTGSRASRAAAAIPRPRLGPKATATGSTAEDVISARGWGIPQDAAKDLVSAKGEFPRMWTRKEILNMERTGITPSWFQGQAPAAFGRRYNVLGVPITRGSPKAYKTGRAIMDFLTAQKSQRPGMSQPVQQVSNTFDESKPPAFAAATDPPDPHGLTPEEQAYVNKAWEESQNLTPEDIFNASRQTDEDLLGQLTAMYGEKVVGGLPPTNSPEFGQLRDFLNQAVFEEPTPRANVLDTDMDILASQLNPAHYDQGVLPLTQSNKVPWPGLKADPVPPNLLRQAEQGIGLRGIINIEDIPPRLKPAYNELVRQNKVINRGTTLETPFSLSDYPDMELLGNYAEEGIQDISRRGQFTSRELARDGYELDVVDAIILLGKESGALRETLPGQFKVLKKNLEDWYFPPGVTSERVTQAVMTAAHLNNSIWDEKLISDTLGIPYDDAVKLSDQLINDGRLIEMPDGSIKIREKGATIRQMEQSVFDDMFEEDRIARAMAEPQPDLGPMPNIEPSIGPPYQAELPFSQLPPDFMGRPDDLPPPRRARNQAPVPNQFINAAGDIDMDAFLRANDEWMQNRPSRGPDARSVDEILDESTPYPREGFPPDFMGRPETDPLEAMSELYDTPFAAYRRESQLPGMEPRYEQGQIDFPAKNPPFPGVGDVRPGDLDRVRDFVADNPTTSLNKIANNLKVGRNRVKAALNELVYEGYVDYDAPAKRGLGGNLTVRRSSEALSVMRQRGAARAARHAVDGGGTTADSLARDLNTTGERAASYIKQLVDDGTLGPPNEKGFFPALKTADELGLPKGVTRENMAAAFDIAAEHGSWNSANIKKATGLPIATVNSMRKVLIDEGRLIRRGTKTVPVQIQQELNKANELVQEALNFSTIGSKNFDEFPETIQDDIFSWMDDNPMQGPMLGEIDPELWPDANKMVPPSDGGAGVGGSGDAGGPSLPNAVPSGGDPVPQYLYNVSKNRDYSRPRLIPRMFGYGALIPNEMDKVATRIRTANMGRAAESIHQLHSVFSDLNPTERNIVLDAYIKGETLGQTALKPKKKGATGFSQLQDYLEYARGVSEEIFKLEQNRGIIPPEARFDPHFLKKQYKSDPALGREPYKGKTILEALEMEKKALKSSHKKPKLETDILTIIGKKVAQAYQDLAYYDFGNTYINSAGIIPENPGARAAVKKAGWQSHKELPDELQKIYDPYAWWEKKGHKYEPNLLTDHQTHLGYDYKLKEIFLDPDDIEILKGADRVFRGDFKDLHKFFQGINWAVNNAKFLMTGANPAYLLRNSAADAFMGFVMNPEAPRYYRKATHVLYDKEIISEAQARNISYADALKTSDGIKRRLSVAANSAARGPGLSPQLGELRRATRKGEYYSWVNGQKVTSTQWLRILNDSGSNGGFVASEIKRMADEVKPRRNPATKGYEKFKRFAGDVGNDREQFFRLSSLMPEFIRHLQGKQIFVGDTDIFTEAAEEAMRRAGERVRKYHLDYGRSTPFESNVMKSVFPFYTFMRQNLPLQLQLLFTRPLAFQLATRGQNTLESLFGAEEEAAYSNMPLYLKKIGAWPIQDRRYPNSDPISNFLSNGGEESLVANITPFVPTGTIDEVFSPLIQSALQMNPRNAYHRGAEQEGSPLQSEELPFRQYGGMITPAIDWPMGALTGEDAQGRSVDWWQDPLGTAFQQFPWTRIGSQTGSDEGVDRATVVRHLTGLPVQSVSQNAETYERVRQREQELDDYMRSRGWR